MGNSPSAGYNDGEDPFDGIDTLGYRVLGVQPESPAAKAGLVSFLDFLVGANGKPDDVSRVYVPILGGWIFLSSLSLQSPHSFPRENVTGFRGRPTRR